MAIERVEYKLPQGYDPARHNRALPGLIAKVYGEGFEIEFIDPEKGVAVASRQGSVNEVRGATNQNVREVAIRAGTKPSDGDKVAIRLADAHPGFQMTKFEPFLGKAVLTRLTDDVARARGALAVALSVKPWEVQVKARKDGGYDLELPHSYVGSKHDAKLEEVATTVVGREGWYVQVNAQKLTAAIIPSDPPTFPEVFDFPLDRLGKGDLDSVSFGRVLPDPGEDAGPEISLDWTASAFVLVAGTPGPQPLDTRIPVPVSDKFPTGWARFGSLDVGDLVYTRHGGTTEIVELHPIRKQAIYTLHLSDGQKIECGANHQWLVSSDYSRKAHGPRAVARRSRPLKKYGSRQAVQPLEQVLQTADLLKQKRRASGGSNWAIRVPGAVDHELSDLPLDPYFLGAWLGDGTSRTSGITVGAEYLDEMRPNLEAIRPVTRVEAKSGTDTVVLHFGRLEAGTCLRGHDDWVEVASTTYCRSCRSDEGRNDPRKNQSVQAILRNLDLIENKHIPADYLRASAAQRLELLRGLMDTDGSVDVKGACELTLTDERLIRDAIELLRSLGIKTSVSESDATITEGGVRRVVGRRWRAHFTTSTQVFKLSSKAVRIPAETRATQQWLYVEDITVGEEADMRCITVADDEHLYLTDGFVPTHNSGKSVLLNAIVSDALSNGSELVVVDDQAKAVDFIWCKDFVRDGGWGCDSLAGAVGALGLVYAEGQRRAKVLAKGGYVNWLDMGKDRFTPILVIVDEVSALLVTDPPMKGIPKDHPLAIEITERNLARAMLQSFITKILAELRFVGIRMVLSTQATNANTGVGPSMRTKIGHSILQGNNPSKAARSQIFSDETAVPTVPEHVKAGGKRSRGVGVTTLEGQPPLIYKTYFAPTSAYGEALRKLKVRTTSRPSPTAAEIDEYLPTLDDEDRNSGISHAPKKGELAPSGKPAAQVAAEMGDAYGVSLHNGSLGDSAFERANAARRAAGVNAGKATPKQKKESAEEAQWAAQSGEVITKPRTPDQNNPFASGDA